MSQKVNSIDFQILSTPEGDSAILEVSDQNGVDFLHVTAVSKNDYDFKFFIGNEDLHISLTQLQKIIDAAKRDIEIVDLSGFE